MISNEISNGDNEVLKRRQGASEGVYNINNESRVFI